jgi:hypothetical protein
MLNNGNFIAIAEPQLGGDISYMPSLVIPDGKGPWALRYIWVQHTERNDEFVANYFNGGNNATGTGLNLRKRTAYMQDAWNPHNAIFETSRDNGNLVWRVKTHNPYANSIDYIEVWRSPEVLSSLFDFDAKDEVEINKNTKRSITARNELREGLTKEGFVIHRFLDANTNWPLISPLQAIRLFRYFNKKFIGQENCIVNTPYNEELNPVEGFNPVANF